MYICYLFKVFSFYPANSHYESVDGDDCVSDAGEDDEGDD